MKKLVRLISYCSMAVAAFGASAQTSTPAACNGGNPIRFAEIGWDSGKFYTEIIRAILERGYGCKTDTVTGSSPITQAALLSGNLDVFVEYWQGRTESFETGAKEGRIQVVGELVEGGGLEGFYVPELVVKGDASRGIKALAPDLKTVSDLAKYKEIFKDEEDPSKGRIYNCPTGWACEKDNNQRMKAYGLEATYNNFRPGTGAALESAISSAFQRGKPIVFSYFAPSSILGKFKAIRLEEPAFSEKCWKTIHESTVPSPCGSASPATNLSVAMTSAFARTNPDVASLVGKVRLQMPLLNGVIAEMSDKKTGADKMAVAFLRQHGEVWTQWVPAPVAAKVQSSLK
ncbi:glycine betaine ABC transporter substrate-binding protein [Variovorax sp. Varisp62]|uniref:glycine betaine ABC transporter substrate-binding protein n=1 Tax=Variovorax sp. Varisp62 TaxID=3243049 RepID=UPI0039B6D0F8